MSTMTKRFSILLSALSWVWLVMPGIAAARGTTSINGNSAEMARTNPNQTGTVTLKKRQPRYRVEPGDVLALNFPFTPDFDQSLTINPDGFITLRSVGSFYAEGKTVPELEAQLAAAYSKVLHDPMVTVDLTNFQKPYFIAGGQVAHPGKYDLRAETTLTEAVEIAGGFTDRSKTSQVLLFRRASPTRFEVRKIDVKKMLRSANRQEDAYLRPGDMVYVPQNKISKIARFLPTSSLGMYFSPAYAY